MVTIRTKICTDLHLNGTFVSSIVSSRVIERVTFKRPTAPVISFPSCIYLNDKKLTTNYFLLKSHRRDHLKLSIVIYPAKNIFYAA